MEKNPVDGYMDNGLAAAFTMMLPGLGQMLKGQGIPGLCWAAIVGGSYLLNGWLGLAFHVLCILDAAFGGGIHKLIGQQGLLKKSAMLMSLTALIIYTCLRTALF